MIRPTTLELKRRTELCLALTVEKKEAMTYEILWYEMLVLNLTEECLSQIEIQIEHSPAIMLVPESVMIQSAEKVGDLEENTTLYKIRPKESVPLTLLPCGREIIRFGFYITMQEYGREVTVSCTASYQDRKYPSNLVKTKIIATTGIPCLVKQSLLLPVRLPKTLTISELNVYYQHQKSTFLPGIIKREGGELCRYTKLLISGVLFYSLKIRYCIGKQYYEETLEYVTGYTQGNILPEGALYAKPEIKLSLYSTDTIQLEGRVYSCSFGFLFFHP